MHKRTNIYLVFLLLFACQTSLFGQVEDDVQEEIEQWIENEESVADYQDLFDQTAMGKSKKLNLNKAIYEDFTRFPFLTPVQILAILKHREKFGKFLTVYELQVIEELDVETIKKMLPFVEVLGSPFEIFRKGSEFDKALKNEFVLTYGERLEKSRGYFATNDSVGPAFAGSPQRYVFRHRINYKNRILAGFTGEKDAGEAFFSGNNPRGFDFNSVHLFIRGGNGLIRNIAIGDYQAAFGQGLTFGSGLAFGKSPFITNIKRNQNGLRPYRSLNENDFLRGAGITLGHKNVESTIFVARNRLDGTVRDVDTLEEFIISSFGTTGLHRTQSEIANKNSVGREMIGGNISYKSNSFSLGYTSVYTKYDYTFVPQDRLYNKFRFSGNTLFNHGVNYSLLTGNLLLFGEVSAVNSYEALSFVQGALMSLGKKLDFSFLHRNISRDYQFTYSTAFTENSAIANEKGTYMGFVYRPSSKWTVNMYYDIYENPWLRFRVDAPSFGQDILTEVQYSVRKKYNMYGRVRVRDRFFNTQNSSNKLNILEPTSRFQARYQLQYILSPEMTIKARVEWVQFDRKIGDSKAEQGALAFFDINRRSNKLKTTFVTRFMVFNTDSYDSRLYAFENDVMYSFTVPAFQNKGTRFYILTKTRLARNLVLWLRLGTTNYSNINVIGSGSDRIDGNRATDFKVQLRWTI